MLGILCRAVLGSEDLSYILPGFGLFQWTYMQVNKQVYHNQKLDSNSVLYNSVPCHQNNVTLGATASKMRWRRLVITVLEKQSRGSGA